MSTITGYKQDTYGSWIQKDTEAQLVYTMDWSEWLATGETIASVVYTIAARANDANPPVIESQGRTAGNTQTYVEISAGSVGKIYTVTASIQTDSGATDRRNFRIRVENRTA